MYFILTLYMSHHKTTATSLATLGHFLKFLFHQVKKSFISGRATSQHACTCAHTRIHTHTEFLLFSFVPSPLPLGKLPWFVLPGPQLGVLMKSGGLWTRARYATGPV